MERTEITNRHEKGSDGTYGQMAGPGALRDPLWGTIITPTAIEMELLRTNAVRRLHYVRHAGPASLHTQHTSTRLQHTLGVFACVAHFAPEWPELRAAALLHDVGHGPFSHALEGLEGFDHHRHSEEVLSSEQIHRALGGLNRQTVLDLIEGNAASPLRSREGVLHADHLDSWVRSAAAFGILPRPASELLSGFKLSGPHLEADADTAAQMIKLIVHEAYYHASADNIGPVAVLRALTQRLIGEGGLRGTEMGNLADEELLALLRRHPATAEETYRFLYRPQELRVVRSDEARPTEAYRHRLNKLYLTLPRIQGAVDPARLPDYPKLEALGGLLGEYHVFWEEGDIVEHR
ncbi:HD domain-containing protein [Saccharibacillus sacchari]|uniref:HD superfamily phosphohydrolase n=1 Tax=Saccharibacillus sacchari DSM 19268 TaxID=915437 RepID=A0A011AMS8_9BACL|nr:HD domain-containing protein [Saccharibacillus sacchari]EXG83266.1 HD superfamily phosphohydrolase [Saccharibacillus sacchari DSM 19268]